MQTAPNLHALQAIDFAIHDAELYLNAYPCEKAESYVQELLERRLEITKSLPTLVRRDASCENFWTKSPLPWELEAN